MKQIYKTLMLIVILILVSSVSIAAVEKPDTKVDIVGGIPVIIKDGLKIQLPPGLNQELGPAAVNYPDTSRSYNDYTAIFGKRSDFSPVYITKNNTWIEILNLTFNVPVAVNANIEGSGQIANFIGYPQIMMSVDGVNGTSRWYVVTRKGATDDCYYCQIGFQISDPFYLTAGTHTVKLYAFDFYPNPSEFVHQQSITAIVDSRGKIQVI